MQKNLMLVGILFVALIGYMSGQSGWSISNLTEARAGNVMPLPQNPQERPPTAPSEVLALQSPQSQAGAQKQASPATQTEPQPSVTPTSPPSSQATTLPQNTQTQQSTSGQQTPMTCAMMGSMGNMGNMGGSSMSHHMDQGLTMREILYIVSMQDTLQAMQDMIRIQEKLLAGVNPADKDAVRKEMDQVTEKLKKLSADYRGMIASQVRSE